jgi:hypothetical protein
MIEHQRYSALAVSASDPKAVRSRAAKTVRMGCHLIATWLHDSLA